ncbi:SDR family oxidoreductase [Streptomyces sp. SRF1]|uniref:SDR family oxidoreductase n=1 Tax=Streptomyces sp. SRF1 TaxID=1549642 RepID=UPI0025B1240B|nr:SDR family oxidoreductase [Streptomyces sp. SRF1]MDN3059755.1 SDR family oxidoreductase [Streptomyces sp. SRF1]
MRVFVTGATGFIGSALVKELVDNGHEVLGMARSDAGAARLSSVGARVHQGDLEDVDSLRRGAAQAEGVIHLAYVHGIGSVGLGARVRILLGGSPSGIPTRFAAAGASADRRAIEVFGSVLTATGGPLVVAFPTMTLAAGHLVTERDAPDATSPGAARIASETATLALASHGVRASVVRIPPTVHGEGDKAMVPRLIAAARKKGVAAYVGQGSNQWSAAYRSDVARLFRLALESGSPGARYHAVGEEGVPMRSIAELIGSRLGVPAKSLTQEEAAGHFGWIAPFVARDNQVSSALTRKELDWTPTGPDLLTDLDRAAYFTAG